MSAGHGTLVILDPLTNRTEEIEIPTRAPRAKVPSRFPKPTRPSLWWGDTHLWANPPYNPADPHNPMLDSKGRVWMTSKIRAEPGSGLVQRSDEQVRGVVPAAQQRTAGVRSTIRRPSSSRSSIPATRRTTCSSTTMRTRRCTSTS